MLTIFAIPKPFRGHINIIQRNAIQSWLKLSPKCEIILFGKEEGTARVAAEFGVLYIPEVARNKFGTPLLNDMFTKAQKVASNKIVALVSMDTMLLNDFLKAVELIKTPVFYMVGRRWDIDIKEELKFNEDNWDKKLRERIAKEGKLHAPTAMDYWVFPRGLWQNIPPFAIGRTILDNWLLHRAWILGIPTIDATRVITAIHQNHDYSHHAKGGAGIWKGPEAKINLKLAGGYSYAFTIRDVNWILTPVGLKKPKLTIYRLLSFPFRYFEKLPALKIFLFPGWLGIILWRKIRHFLIK